MGRPISTGYSLLSELVLYFNESFIHEYVYNEVQSGGARAHLKSLERQGLIEVVSDKTLLDMLYDAMAQNEEAACNYYQSSLKRNIDMLKPAEQAILTGIYSSILSNSFSLRNDLLTSLSAIDACILNGSSTGELKTSILVDILYFINLVEIDLFVSNDNRARYLMTVSTGQRVQTSSPIGTFIFLRDTGMTKKDAEPYLIKMGPNTDIAVKDINGRRLILKYHQVFNDIFANASNVSLSPDGIIKY